jgi:ABC-type multidrug transport system permease subunit
VARSGRAGRIARWFHRFTATYFLVTAATGLALYFRPLSGEREGWYGDGWKEWLVMLHNGELFSWLVSGNRYISGLLIGAALAGALAYQAWRALRGTGTSRRRAG